jgi:hypothetical protein
VERIARAVGFDPGAAGGCNSGIVPFNAVLILGRLGHSAVGASLDSRFQHNLTGTADRLAALGGSREGLRSGTTILGHVPAPEYTS